MNKAQLKDYGWNGGLAPESCGYIAPVVMQVLASLKPNSVLDLGCGNGALCSYLLAHGYGTAGVERDAAGLQLARTSCPEAKFYQLDMGDDPMEILTDWPSGFDVVVSTEVVEHLYLPRQLPRFARAVLRPGGYLLITTPYHGYLKNLALSILGHWDKHHGPLWDGGHIKFFSRRTLSSMLEEEGFSVRKFQGVGRAPWLWKSMLLLAQRD